MGRITRYLQQVALYWAPGANDRFGQPTWVNPVEVRCRWEDVTEEFIDKDGQKQVSRSKVIVEVKLIPSGYLWLSERRASDSPGSALADIKPGTSPLDMTEAYPIKAFSSVPDRKAQNFYREAKL